MDQYVDVAWYSVGEWGNLLQQKMKYFNDPAQYPPVFPVQQIDVGVVVVAVASLNAIGTHTHTGHIPGSCYWRERTLFVQTVAYPVVVVQRRQL